ncbi:MAG: hypothetical protein ACTMII_06730 [Brachybacterium sp.]
MSSTPSRGGSSQVPAGFSEGFSSADFGPRSARLYLGLSDEEVRDWQGYFLAGNAYRAPIDRAAVARLRYTSAAVLAGFLLAFVGVGVGLFYLLLEQDLPWMVLLMMVFLMVLTSLGAVRIALSRRRALIGLRSPEHSVVITSQGITILGMPQIPWAEVTMGLGWDERNTPQTAKLGVVTLARLSGIQRAELLIGVRDARALRDAAPRWTRPLFELVKNDGGVRIPLEALVASDEVRRTLAAALFAAHHSGVEIILTEDKWDLFDESMRLYGLPDSEAPEEQGQELAAHGVSSTSISTSTSTIVPQVVVREVSPTLPEAARELAREPAAAVQQPASERAPDPAPEPEGVQLGPFAEVLTELREAHGVPHVLGNGPWVRWMGGPEWITLRRDYDGAGWLCMQDAHEAADAEERAFQNPARDELPDRWVAYSPQNLSSGAFRPRHHLAEDAGQLEQWLGEMLEEVHTTLLAAPSELVESFALTIWHDDPALRLFPRFERWELRQLINWTVSVAEGDERIRVRGRGPGAEAGEGFPVDAEGCAAAREAFLHELRSWEVPSLAQLHYSASFGQGKGSSWTAWLHGVGIEQSTPWS